MSIDLLLSKNNFDGPMTLVGMKLGDVIFILKSIVHHESSKGMG